jgi:hypothetical protein
LIKNTILPVILWWNAFILRGPLVGAGFLLGLGRKRRFDGRITLREVLVEAW